MKGMKVFKLVQYLKSVEFYHDTFDLEEEGVRAVLSDYGINDELTAEEVQELGKELYELAEKNEFREAMKFADDTQSLGEIRSIERV